MKQEALILTKRKGLKLMKNKSINNSSCYLIFSYNRFLLLFLKWLNFNESWFIFPEKIFSTSLLFLILKIIQ